MSKRTLIIAATTAVCAVAAGIGAFLIWRRRKPAVPQMTPEQKIFHDSIKNAKGIKLEDLQVALGRLKLGIFGGIPGIMMLPDFRLVAAYQDWQLPIVDGVVAFCEEADQIYLVIYESAQVAKKHTPEIAYREGLSYHSNPGYVITSECLDGPGEGDEQKAVTMMVINPNMDSTTVIPQHYLRELKAMGKAATIEHIIYDNVPTSELANLLGTHVWVHPLRMEPTIALESYAISDTEEAFACFSGFDLCAQCDEQPNVTLMPPRQVQLGQAIVICAKAGRGLAFNIRLPKVPATAFVPYLTKDLQVIWPPAKIQQLLNELPALQKVATQGLI
eukprot:TRINITY_DN963_c0_g3_i1.p1 TRINITY_DN963_c0_g3~~TRINITY_DN963_c0_g3_i1.p1  ORF type:complete len:332 (+),score=61.24 TRINITY_DN963_c0_g3_i1:161-1156(+)